MRLLRSAIGPRVARVGPQESGLQRVAQAVSWLREHFAQPVTLADLADLANMGLSSFHQQFKSVTSMSPLQYQKVLRLHEARRLMLARLVDVGGAGRAGRWAISVLRSSAASTRGSSAPRRSGISRGCGKTLRLGEAADSPG